MRPTATALLIVLSAGPVSAQQVTATLNANLPPVARLSLSSNTIVFPDADPDTVPLVASSPPTIAISAKARTVSGSTITLTVEAPDDLRSGLDTISISTITWTATGTGFVGGTLRRTSQVLGTWTGSGVRAGDQSFLFANKWSYPTGTYTATILYTLSAP